MALMPSGTVAGFLRCPIGRPPSTADLMHSRFSKKLILWGDTCCFLGEAQGSEVTLELTITDEIVQERLFIFTAHPLMPLVLQPSCICRPPASERRITSQATS